MPMNGSANMVSSKGAWVPDWLRASEGQALTTVPELGNLAVTRAPLPIADPLCEPFGELSEANEKLPIAGTPLREVLYGDQWTIGARKSVFRSLAMDLVQEIKEQSKAPQKGQKRKASEDRVKGN